MFNIITRNGLILALFALCCTGLVASVNFFTEDRIIDQQRKQLAGILEQIIPNHLHDNELTEDCILVTNQEFLGSDEALPVYIAKMNNEPIAIAIEAIAPDGYNGDIKIILGVNNDNELLGVRTLTHQETPGLGDKIELRKSDWVLGFSNLLYDPNSKPMAVKKDGGDIDQFTGATITPRAYVNAINNALAFVSANRESLYNTVNHCGREND
ncbi:MULTISPECIES: electron transport complex subunit RsxG [Shewanella]|uniref:Ion-translocating oxidoreductase complex subunit G n=1 Tax=Shewanella electrodiphila TaxID=934143 RepID=A0ABT0KMN8_9GAMM|nr:MULTISPECIES: electron transport complex subunit RsxG [Shewanella]MCC4831974.1 electron transport complex subunit RsxG [Shewanella sp. 10N.7]MCL1045103.1 electron transport complex subunit RsxG [Shewanella electrodiphila]PMG81048.1 electron transport complex subunit RsxG [Shewanella sp. 10N.286.51.B7]